MRRSWKAALTCALALALGAPGVARAQGDVRICVEVDLREPRPVPAEPAAAEEGEPEEPEEAATATRDEGRVPFWPLPPMAYLHRLLEHHVTHEPGFVAVDADCQERLVVELYPLREGWTAFARYTGYQQEEKVDRVYYEELPRLADRLVRALLYRKGVEETIDRTNVLEADSQQDLRTIRGESHFLTGVGTSLKIPVAGIATAPDDPEAPTEDEVRPVSTVDLALGYRGNFRSWGVDTFFMAGIAAGQRKAPRNNLPGGHVDHTGSLHVGLDFLWYLDPDAVNTFYVGAGGRLDLQFFRAVKSRERVAAQSDDDPLVGAGLSGIGLVGYELLRANDIRPYVQLDLALPLYAVDAENDFGRVHTWLPSVGVRIGALF